MSKKQLYLLINERPGGLDLEGVITTRDKAREYGVWLYPKEKLGRDGIPWPLAIEEVPLDPEPIGKP